MPDAHTDVKISAGILVVNINAECRTLSVQPGVAVTVKAGYNITVVSQ